MMIGFAMTAAALMSVQQMPAAADQLGWLTGNWEERRPRAEGAQQGWTDEIWMAPRGGVLLGIGRRGEGPRLGMFEFMSIRPGSDGVLVFHAQQDGEGETIAFRLARSGPGEAVFENPNHDYPQRIAYRRSGANLVATISRMDGSGERSWTFQPRPLRTAR
ncbi:MAG TPA: DUF6265 family protein [Allosphingosinicella sp.]|jgi:hypothetical protein